MNTVYLYDDKILIAFNYKESTKIIPLDDIAALTAWNLTKQNRNPKPVDCDTNQTYEIAKYFAEWYEFLAGSLPNFV